MERKYRIQTIAPGERFLRIAPKNYNAKGRRYELQERRRYGFSLFFFIIPYYVWETIGESIDKKKLCDYAKQKGYELS